MTLDVGMDVNHYAGVASRDIFNNLLYTTGVGNIDSMNYENTVPLLELCPSFFSLDIF